MEGMYLIRRISISVLVALCCLSLHQKSTAQSLGESPKSFYQLGEASRDGIGKFYMGREISQVMGHLGASWLERPAREQEERTDLLIKNMNLKPEDQIADIGAGSGYFSFRMAQLVPKGKVFAVDISPQMLGLIRSKIKILNTT